MHSGVVQLELTAKPQRRRSNLVDMSHDMSIQFGQEVPLYSKPLNWPASPPPAAQPFVRPQSTFQAHNPIHGCAIPCCVEGCLHVLGICVSLQTPEPMLPAMQRMRDMT